MGKTVAIITMHGVKNFGSYLQTIATYDIFASRGYQPVIVDYLFPNEAHKKHYYGEKRSINEDISFPKRIIRYVCKKILAINPAIRAKRFDESYSTLRFTRKYNTPEELSNNVPDADYYVSGSDQVWNPTFVGDDTSFLLSWAPDEKKKFSLASSFSNNELPKELASLYKNYLSRFDGISIREQSSILNQLLGIEGTVVLDPTLWIDKEEWKNKYIGEPIVKGDYIACYLLGYSFNPFPYAYKVISQIKRMTGCKKVVVIDGHPEDILRGYNVISNIGPCDFLNILYYSKFVLSSSFHGTAFAINFQKPFCSIIDGDSKDIRQKSLLSLLGLEDRVLRVNTTITTAAIQTKLPSLNLLEEQRAISNDYLSNVMLS